jgi:beta-glucanase (GH16 family)
MTYKRNPLAIAVAVATLALSACGESDLPEYHLDVLAEAQRAQNEQELGAATPTNEDTLTGETAGTDDSAGSTGTSSTSGSDSSDSSEDTAGSDSTDGADGSEGTAGSDSSGSTDGTDASEGTAGSDSSGGTDGTDSSEGTDGSDSSGGTDGTDAVEGTDGASTTDSGGSDTAAGNGTGDDTSSLDTTSVQNLDLVNDFQLVFADEFDGNSLDFTQWKTRLEWGPDLIINEEQQYYVDTESLPDFGYDPFRVEGGTLTISAIPTPAELSASASGQPWLSGVLTTATRFDMQYGYIEARVDLPVGAGVWPSLWMLSSDYNETDLKPRVFIAEYNGGQPGSIFHNYQYEDTNGAVRSPGQFRVQEETLADGFHTLGLSWTPDDLVYYINGEPRYRVVGDRLPQQAMYLILNLAIGGVWVDEPDASTPNPVELTVDYVRIYEPKP